MLGTDLIFEVKTCVQVGSGRDLKERIVTSL